MVCFRVESRESRFSYRTTKEVSLQILLFQIESLEAFKLKKLQAVKQAPWAFLRVLEAICISLWLSFCCVHIYIGPNYMLKWCSILHLQSKFYILKFSKAKLRCTFFDIRPSHLIHSGTWNSAAFWRAREPLAFTLFKSLKSLTQLITATFQPLNILTYFFTQ